jgi:hypothetical protein
LFVCLFAGVCLFLLLFINMMSAVLDLVHVSMTVLQQAQNDNRQQKTQEQQQLFPMGSFTASCACIIGTQLLRKESKASKHDVYQRADNRASLTQTSVALTDICQQQK